MIDFSRNSTTSIIFEKCSSLPSFFQILTPVSGPPPGAKLVPVSLPSNISVQKATPAPESDRSKSPELSVGSGGAVVSRAYSRTSSSSASASASEGTPKIPRKYREIQENLNFEKVRRTGAKNIAEGQEQDEEPTKEMSVEEIKEFMEEQRKRLKQMRGEDEEDEDEDDYYDNDAGMNDDDYPEEEEGENVSTFVSVPTRAPTASSSSTPSTPSRPILKTERPDGDSPSSAGPRKSVRFSLRSGTVPTPQSIDAPAAAEDAARKSTAPKKRGRPPSASATSSSAESTTSLQETLDNTVDVFNQAAEEEEEDDNEEEEMELTTLTTTTRSGRVVKKMSSEQDEAEESLSRKRGKKSSPKSENASPPTKKRRVSSNGADPAQDHTHLVNELLKKNPNLLRNNKQVKLKVMAKNAQGKSVVQYITLKASDHGGGGKEGGGEGTPKGTYSQK